MLLKKDNMTDKITKRERIETFINELVNEYGDLPKFAHGVNNKKNQVYYSGPSFDEKELVSAIEALLFGKWGATGENVYKFEKKFSDFVKMKYSLMVNSGSSANLVLITALKKYFNWQDGDEVIISVVGFPTTLSPIVINNLKPVFIDIELDSLNFDLTKIEEKITDKTKAIFISPVLGNSPDMDFLLELKNKYNLELILDGCDSLGSKWDGKELTEYAVASTCSFYASHHICTIEGGMVSSNNEDIVKLARSIAWWGRDCYCIGSSNLLPNGSCGMRFSNHWLNTKDDILIDHKYVFANIGYNLKPIDMQGAMGLVQLEKFPEFETKRRKNKKKIESIFLNNIKGLKPIFTYDKSDPSWFGVPVICDTNELKNKLVKHLETNNIQTRNYFAGNILLHPAYQNLDNWELYPNANQVLEKIFFVGCSPNYTDETIKYIEEVITNFE
jgi:CDP-6-deoxy-D-xylo-4-hexulose-3-dehydrase